MSGESSGRHLNQDTRTELLKLLAQVPGLDTSAGRDRLLRDLPVAITDVVPREAARAVDLDHMVDYCDRWQTPADAKAPLLILIENARYLARESQTERNLKQLQDKLFAPPSPKPPPPCPYPGLEAFDADHKRFFYGREAETVQAVDHLREHPLLVVIGPSGTGKSSLIKAGVLPTLEEGSPTSGARCK
jgi:hypothetical protein